MQAIERVSKIRGCKNNGSNGKSNAKNNGNMKNADVMQPRDHPRDRNSRSDDNKKRTISSGGRQAFKT